MRLARGLVAAALMLSARRAGAVDPRTAMVAQSEDNSFLIQEAYTQDAGTVQSYSTAELDGGGGDRSLELALNPDWPLFSSDHQLTVTLPIEVVSGDDDAAGLGDVSLHYVYQLVHESERAPAVAPSFGLAFPTGRESDGFGDGNIGYAFELPVSKVLTDRLQMNLNVGASFVPHTQGAFLDDYSGGASAVFAVTPDLDLLLEWTAASEQQVDHHRSDRDFVSQISPGVRHAFDVAGGQLVLGLAAPTGLTSESPDWGVLFYFSFERRFWN